MGSSSPPHNQAVHGPQLDITPETFSSPYFLLGYSAGLFEGEGHVGITRKQVAGLPPSYVLRVGIKMGDREPLDRLCAQWGGRVRLRPEKDERRRDMFAWNIEGQKALAFLGAIRKHVISDRIRSKLELAIRFQEQKHPRGGRGLAASQRSFYRDQQKAYYQEMRLLNQRGRTQPSGCLCRKGAWNPSCPVHGRTT